MDISEFGDSNVDEFCETLRQTKSFDELEIKILKAMFELISLKREKNTASDIARRANISVTNAYKYLYSLQNKGIVESNKSEQNGKNMLFWLTQSLNPFPRILSYIGKEYLAKKELFYNLEKLYSKLKPIDKIWHGEKIYEDYKGAVVNKISLLIDMSKREILITTDKFFDDFVILDSFKRAASRGVVIKIIAEQINPSLTEKLRQIGIEMRLGYGWPYVILVDENHGMTMDRDEKGVWFLNQKTDYKNKFSGFWEHADEI